MSQDFFPTTTMPDADWWGALWPRPDELIERLNLSHEAVVVDLCCGNGLFTIPIARVARHVTAVDVDPVLLVSARDQSITAGLTNCTFINGDAYALVDLVPTCLDWVLIANTFHGVPDKARLVRAVAAVLKPGGRFCVVNWQRRPREETIVLGEPRGPQTEVRMTPDDVAAAVTPNGFRQVEVFDIPPYHYASIFERADAGSPLLLGGKDYAAASVFRPENLLREARRQKLLPLEAIPEICVLDPDGDMVRLLRRDGRAQPCPGWACYHTDLCGFEHQGERFGIVGCAVGASFAVLVAEQLFASGCRFVISITSAGQIEPSGPPPYFILIDQALRDEGTSHHYLPPALFARANSALLLPVMRALSSASLTVVKGATWTTDAPFRETAAAIEQARQHGALAVEMEAAALYAFAQAQNRSVLCFAHVTNQMAQIEGDFEKGEANGAHDALELVAAVARSWRAIGQDA